MASAGRECEGRTHPPPAKVRPVRFTHGRAGRTDRNSRHQRCPHLSMPPPDASPATDLARPMPRPTAQVDPFVTVLGAELAVQFLL